MAEQTVTLQPGESEVLAFETIPSEAKTYQVSVDDLVGSFVAVERGVEGRIKNPPYRGNYWQLVLFNEVWGDSVRVGMHIPTDQPMTLKSLPAGWTFPLYIDIMIYEFNVSPYNIVYKVQSAYGSDWSYYKNITIPDYGGYYYNVSTGRIEKYA